MRFVLSRVRLVLRRLALLVTVTLNCLICFLYFALFASLLLSCYYSALCPKCQVRYVIPLQFTLQIQFVLYANFVVQKPQCVVPRFANLLQVSPR